MLINIVIETVTSLTSLLTFNCELYIVIAIEGGNSILEQHNILASSYPIQEEANALD